MLTKVIFPSVLKVFSEYMSLPFQKFSHEMLDQELESAKRKRQALEGLLNTGKISQLTYNYLKKEITNTISEIEKQQRAQTEEAVPKVVVIEESVKTKAKKKKRIRKAKKRKVKKPSTKKVKKKSTGRAPSKKGYSRSRVKGRCRNPWNGECRNTDIEVIIYYKKSFLPICRECWNDIAEKDLAW